MERTPTLERLAIALLGVGLMSAAPRAQAHPHMWIDARAAFVFDDASRLSAVTQRWLFDEMFSPFSMQGVKKNKNGTYPAATLTSMANDWMGALAEPVSHFFTRVTVDGKVLSFGKPRDAALAWDDKLKRLALTFTLPLANPVSLAATPARIDIYDPTYFVAYAFDEKNAVSLTHAPAGCQSDYHRPRELDFATMQQLAAIPADADPDALPEELFAITRGLTHRIDIKCE